MNEMHQKRMACELIEKDQLCQAHCSWFGYHHHHHPRLLSSSSPPLFCCVQNNCGDVLLCIDPDHLPPWWPVHPPKRINPPVPVGSWHPASLAPDAARIAQAPECRSVCKP
ncbi:hypothetical protein M758_3G034900 [Ceratodon purpureus]|nr:hypothetical protein M758_3G034900 [Ceratodon purpureus]